MVSALEQLAKAGVYDPKTDLINKSLGTTAALNNVMMSLGGREALNKYPWLQKLFDSAKTGTPVSSMEHGTEKFIQGGKVVTRPTVK
jgi:hypothetical protein